MAIRQKLLPIGTCVFDLRRQRIQFAPLQSWPHSLKLDRHTSTDQIRHFRYNSPIYTSRKTKCFCVHIHAFEINKMLRSAQQQGGCWHYDGCQGEGFNYTPPHHTVCSMEPNKLECQSQTHLGARSCISGYINQ